MAFKTIGFYGGGGTEVNTFRESNNLDQYKSRKLTVEARKEVKA